MTSMLQQYSNLLASLSNKELLRWGRVAGHPEAGSREGGAVGGVEGGHQLSRQEAQQLPSLVLCTGYLCSRDQERNSFDDPWLGDS